MPDQTPHYAGFWIRVAVTLVDTVLVVVIAFLSVMGTDLFSGID